MSDDELFGRDEEFAALAALIDGLPKAGGALVVRGAPGIGKSALLARAARQAELSGVTVLTASGVEAESQLPFVGLYQLTRTMLDQVPGLPPVQAEALLGAFGLAEPSPTGRAPQLFMIALATLDLLGEAAGQAPVLLVVDDAQWLDAPTVGVLAFIARRLGSEPLGMLFGIRDGHTTGLDALALRELRLRPLTRTEAGALLDAVEPQLEPPLRHRVLDAAAGNPLALIELPAALRERGATAEALTSSAIPLTSRLEQAFASRLLNLPSEACSVLLVAASDDEGELGEVLAAASILAGTDLSPESLSPALAIGLVTADEHRIRFCHPLVRSAVLQTASLAERLAAHRALATVLDGQPDRQTWHRAAASDRRDESVAMQLDLTAARAEARGASAVALAALERSMALGENPARKGKRLLKAAELALELGRTDQAAALLQLSEPLERDVLERARAVLLSEGLELDVSTSIPRLHLLIATAEEAAAAGDPELALRLLRAAARRCWWSDPGRALRERVVAAAERLPVPELHPDLIFVLVGATPLERGATVIERFERLERQGGFDALAASTLGTAATMMGGYDHAAGFLRHAAAGLRAQGRLGLLAQTLVSLSFTSAHIVDWESGLPSVAEAIRLAEENAQPRWLTGALIAKAHFSAVLGDVETAQTVIEQAERQALAVASPSNLAFIQITRGVIGLAAGRHAEAFACVWRVFDPTDPAHHPYLQTIAISTLAEAAVSDEERALARKALSRLDESAATTTARLIRANLGLAHALLADDEDAEASFRSALALDLSRDPFTRARLLLAYGIWLRRRRRVMESRAPLRIAKGSFASLGAQPWHERACQELRSAGEGGAQSMSSDWDVLTPQELQIAQLASTGLSNREIAQQLYLSHRTIGAHLYRIYPKLGITSRGQLRDKLQLGGW
ncbi:LuxR family transcriptional regulator [Streptomyces sp. AC550_RSS872]|uniref:helix-turn-helix transcriptional regulator n=1 Tax=Streptomyces sp. AC550_RSS872 TaxID=2823689 RepID=UPI001C277C84|nr:LuxR family transcriptional regulator [Streptomyces sp. AC550_RSS872]